MDDPKIKLYPTEDSGDAAVWRWELLLHGKKVAAGKSEGYQEHAYKAARQALIAYRKQHVGE